MCDQNYIKHATKKQRGERIVFSTIRENIRSFFAREQELAAAPKKVPEAASEIFERPRIVEKSLPSQPVQQVVPKLPFSPEQLRAALSATTFHPPDEKPVIIENKTIDREIAHEIAAFENALATAHKNVPQKLPDVPSFTAEPLDESFFTEFSQFLKRENLAAEGLLEKDILWRMKEFHKHRQEGKEYYLLGKDVQAAIERKIGELRKLEQEWFTQKAHADSLEHNVQLVEREIETRTAELKQLVRQANAKSRLEHTVPEGYELTLIDGRKLRSLLDLKNALRNMPDTVFASHVNPMRNDFAAWIRGSMNDPELGAKLTPIRDREQMEKFIREYADKKPEKQLSPS
jgi:hypothetical protein